MQKDINSRYCYHCKKCQLYFNTTHPDPEMREDQPHCPRCGTGLILSHGGNIEVLKKEIHLFNSEIGTEII